MTAPLVSIVIRTRNEEALLARTLDAVRKQSGPGAEIIIVDSGSTDGTLSIARGSDVTLIEIPPASFTYGHALNVGARAARGRFLVNLSAHAVPAAATWLEELLRAYEQATSAGHRVAGVFGRQLPMPDAWAPVQRDCAGSYGPSPRIIADRPFFSNANALIPRAVWEEEPFDENLPYSEDAAWVQARIAEGQVAVYTPHAAVLHSHNETLAQVFRRSRAEGAGSLSITGEQWSLGTALGSWRYEWAADRRYLAQCGGSFGVRAWCHSPLYRLAQAFGAYAGRRTRRPALRGGRA